MRGGFSKWAEPMVHRGRTRRPSAGVFWVTWKAFAEGLLGRGNPGRTLGWTLKSGGVLGNDLGGVQC
ncbi:hypothetical protein HDA44_005619 [Kribbella solani]|uniref:Uncharacterized protein n=1 Tax=Kribbella solani TaxID=236067 RepID=A0A841E4K8_9ACTN|nr:hypothetical protein [Kribbella solani]